MTEQRGEARIDHNVRLFVHVHRADDEPEMVGVSLEGEAVDFSAHGMQFKTKAELSPGTRLNITVGIGKPFCMYLLRGDLRWSRRTEDGQYSMGVLLIPAEGTDFDTWLEAFDQLFDDTPD